MKVTREYATGRRLIFLSMLLHTVGCGALALTNIVYREKAFGNPRPATAVGVTFWAANALGLLVMLLCCRQRRIIERETDTRTKGLPGIIRFFKNKAAIVVDVLFFIALLATAASLVFQLSGYFALAAIVLTLTLFSYHSYLNGKNYRFFTVKKQHRYLKR